MNLGKYRLSLLQRKVFVKKLLLLCLATLLLLPLIYYKLSIPATIYLVALIIIHLVFLFLYLFKVEWRKLTLNKTTFTLRLVAVIFFAYLLAILKFVGDPLFITINITAAFVIHALILLMLMVVIEKGSKPR